MSKHKSTTTAPAAAQNTTIPNTPLRFLWYTVRPFWPIAAIGFFFSSLTQVIASFLPLFFGRFVDDVTTTQDFEQFAFWSIAFVVINIIFFTSFRTAGFLAIKLVLQQQVFAFQRLKEYLLQHSHTFYINRFAGALANKLFHAADRSGDILLMTFYGFIRLTVSIVAGGILIAFIDWKLTLVYFFIVLVTVGVNIYLVRLRRPHVVAYAQSSSVYRGQITDVVTNIQAVRQFARTWGEYGYLNQTLDDRIAKDRRQWRMAEWNHVINNALTIVLLAVMVGGTLYLLYSGQSTIGDMVAVMLVMYRVSGIMVDIGDWMNRVVRVYGEVEEGLQEILVEHEIVDAPNAVPLVATSGSMTWENVTFTYGENQVFKDFNLTIEPGQRVGLVGPSGAGKTTFVSLLLRQHELDAGTISIEGQDIAAVTQDSLRANIAVVPQEPMLFHRSIRENIAYGKPDATDDEIVEVAKKAQAHDFISGLPDGYGTLVGERGVKLSGGQKQRIAIARAMLKDAPILVLDEATSALDSESEVEIQKALHILMEGKTVVAIAHRLSTLREMDRILVLENGRIVEDGAPDELKSNGGTYARLWEHQAGGFLVE